MCFVTPGSPYLEGLGVSLHTLEVFLPSGILQGTQPPQHVLLLGVAQGRAKVILILNLLSNQHSQSLVHRSDKGGLHASTYKGCIHLKDDVSGQVLLLIFNL